MKVKQIVEGFKNLVLNKNEILSNKRTKICSACPFKTQRNTCGKCGCYLPAKTKVERASCPEGIITRRSLVRVQFPLLIFKL
jgi:topoisomerase IA-like protein